MRSYPDSILVLLLVFWAAVATQAQEARGVRKAGDTVLKIGKKALTRAVVVGVSEYADPEISDLRFAHRDAEIFADSFLRSPSGGRLGDSQIRLLTNAQASAAAIQAALVWLVNTTAPGDQAIIYFSGHGDVETRNAEEKGYLLAHDTPKNNYRLNAIDLSDLNEHVIGALSERGAKVVVITDACHSGALAGEGIGGPEATASELMKRFSEEIRIMSCQPYERSLESPRWGGGRGVFSYYLVDGLRGLADDDGDRRVDLFELEIYLQERIRSATDKTQHPDIFGGHKDAALFQVDEATLASLSAVEKSDIEADLEKNILLKLASEEGYRNYTGFTRALEYGRLMAPAGRSALDYRKALYADTSFIALRGLIDERFTVALLDSAQQALNAYLKTDPEELARRDRFDAQYARYPEYLAQAAELLGPNDPRYRPTLAKRYYFEGLVLRMAAEQAGGSDSLFRLALEQQQKAVELEQRAAYIHNELGYLQLELGNLQEGMTSLQRAAALAPTWAVAHNNLAVGYRQLDSLQTAKWHYQQAVALKPDFSSACTNLGNLLAALDQPDSAQLMLQKAIDLNPEDPDNFFNLAVFLSGVDGRHTDAVTAYRNALGRRENFPEAWNGLGVLYDAAGETDSAEHCYRRALEIDSTYTGGWQNLGLHLYGRERLEEALQMFLVAYRLAPELEDLPAQLATVLIELDRWKAVSELALPAQAQSTVLRECGFLFFGSEDYKRALAAFERAASLAPDDPDSWYLLSVCHAHTGAKSKALRYLEKTLNAAGSASAGYREQIDADEHFESLKTTRRYRALLQDAVPR